MHTLIASGSFWPCVQFDRFQSWTSCTSGGSRALSVCKADKALVIESVSLEKLSRRTTVVQSADEILWDLSSTHGCVLDWFKLGFNLKLVESQVGSVRALAMRGWCLVLLPGVGCVARSELRQKSPHGTCQL